MKRAFINARFLTGFDVISDKALIVNGDHIAGFAEPGSLSGDVEVVDCDGLLVTAGLIDLQIAGAGGFLFSAHPTPEALKAITGAILQTGTTGFLIAIPTNTREVYSEAFRTVRENPHPAVMGLHLEGPFISYAKRGAHVKEQIRQPSVREIESLLNEAEGVIRMMTLAPETCTHEIIDLLRSNGVIVSAGHSNATYDEASDGFAWGIGTTTHLFNAMSPMHHRDPGLPGAVFNSDSVCASIIADGIHVSYSMLAIAKKIMKERLFLISDAVEENDRGMYQHVRQYDRYTLPDGTLSGANLTMLSAVRNCVENAGIAQEEALRMASLYPARLIKASDRGIIAAGARADLLMLDDHLEIKRIYFNGKQH